jgi:hypothetical protein
MKMLNIRLASLLSLSLCSLIAIGQQSYWSPEFTTSHNLKNISKYQGDSKQDKANHELVLKLEYNLNGQETSRWTKEDGALYLWTNSYTTSGQLSKSIRFHKLDNDSNSFDTIMVSTFSYPNDSTQVRQSLVPGQKTEEASVSTFPLKEVKEALNRAYFGEPTFNQDGLLIQDHWGFQQNESYGCIISSIGDLYYRLFNYNPQGQKVSETWFKNEQFFRSINYFYTYQGLPKFEVISTYDHKLDLLKTQEYFYSIN